MVMSERHVGKDADLGFECGKQALVEGGIHQVADERRIRPRPLVKVLSSAPASPD